MKHYIGKANNQCYCYLWIFMAGWQARSLTIKQKMNERYPSDDKRVRNKKEIFFGKAKQFAYYLKIDSAGFDLAIYQ